MIEATNVNVSVELLSLLSEFAHLYKKKNGNEKIWRTDDDEKSLKTSIEVINKNYYLNQLKLFEL